MAGCVGRGVTPEPKANIAPGTKGAGDTWGAAVRKQPGADPADRSAGCREKSVLQTGKSGASDTVPDGIVETVFSEFRRMSGNRPCSKKRDNAVPEAGVRIAQYSRRVGEGLASAREMMGTAQSDLSGGCATSPFLGKMADSAGSRHQKSYTVRSRANRTKLMEKAASIATPGTYA